MTIYVIRHGETNANNEGRIQGWIDDPLNENGILLAEITGQNMKGIHFDAVYSSPLIRAKQTAEIIQKNSGNEDAPLYTDERLKEINMGEWERKKFRLPDCEVPIEKVREFFATPPMDIKFTNGESLNEVKKRTQEFLKELLAKNDDGTYLVSTHGCAMRSMLNFLYDDPSDFWQNTVPHNCSVNIIESKNNVTKIVEKDIIFYPENMASNLYNGI